MNRALPGSCGVVQSRRVGLFATCGACWLLLVFAPWAAAQMPPARVSVAEVQQRQLTIGQTFVGTVMPARTSTVGSTIEGRVVELAVHEGDAVSQGDTLAKLRTERLEIQLAAAEAEREVRKLALAQLEDSLPEEIRQAHARTAAAEALMKLARSRYRRAQSLFERIAISEDELQETESGAVAAEQKHLETELAWQLAVKILPVKLRHAQAQVDVQQEEIRRFEDDIAEHTIRAPFGGYVTKELTEVGQWIAKGDPVAEVIEVDEVDVEVSVLESYVAQLRVGMTARVTIGAIPGKSWEAPLSAIVPQGDVRSRSFPVKVRLKNQSGGGGVLFKPGMFARVTLPLGKQAEVLLVPKDAVVLGGEAPVVYVVEAIRQRPAAAAGPPQIPTRQGGPPAVAAPDAVARRVPVELGAAVAAESSTRIESLIEVRGPLGVGDLVVVEGNERLFPGAPLILVDRSRLPKGKAALEPSK